MSKSENKQFAVVGLGNPGKRYENTRHNIGADAVVRFADSIGAPSVASWRTKNDAFYSKVDFDGAAVHLILPQTFMNLSGESVQPLTAFFRIEPQSLVVVYDELELAPGTVRIKRGGSAGGHNGVSSIIERLGGNDFYRIRIGIGRPQVPSGANKREIVSSWVLSRPRPDDRGPYDQGVEAAVEALKSMITDGPTVAQNRFNRREVPKDEPEKPQ
jgi:PTH1 family peptidyl-tRNA hydrolase